MTGNYASIREEKSLLDGICPDAAEILKNRKFQVGTVRAIKQMKPIRQVEMVELMVAANNFSRTYAWALLMATPAEQLKEPEKKKMIGELTDDERRRMELELENLRLDMKSVQEDYGANVVRLVVANGYVMRLLDVDRIVQYLGRNHADLLAEMQAVTESISSETGTAHQGDVRH